MTTKQLVGWVLFVLQMLVLVGFTYTTSKNAVGPYGVWVGWITGMLFMGLGIVSGELRRK